VLTQGNSSHHCPQGLQGDGEVEEEEGNHGKQQTPRDYHGSEAPNQILEGGTALVWRREFPVVKVVFVCLILGESEAVKTGV